jgi:hypothetical protein
MWLFLYGNAILVAKTAIIKIEIAKAKIKIFEKEVLKRKL